MPTRQTKEEKTTTPLPVLVGETRLMYTWCQTDKDDLVAIGLKWTIIESLSALCDNCESLYLKCKMEKIAISQYRRDLKKSSELHQVPDRKLPKRYVMRYTLQKVNKRFPFITGE